MANTLKMRRPPVLAARYSDQEKWLKEFHKAGRSLMLGGDAGRRFDHETIARRKEILKEMRNGEDPAYAASSFVAEYGTPHEAREMNLDHLDESVRRLRSGRRIPFRNR